MSAQRPSAGLMLILGVVVLFAVIMLGRRVLDSSPAADTQDPSGLVETANNSTPDPAPIERWVPPDVPRDPFAPLVFGATTTTTAP